MERLDLADLRNKNVDRLYEWHDSPSKQWTRSDWMVATLGELGEAANYIKKLNRIRDGITGNEETPGEIQNNLEEEIADTMIYLDLMAYNLGIDLAQVVKRKFNKTSIKHGFSQRL